MIEVYFFVIILSSPYNLRAHAIVILEVLFLYALFTKVALHEIIRDSLLTNPVALPSFLLHRKYSP